MISISRNNPEQERYSQRQEPKDATWEHAKRIADEIAKNMQPEGDPEKKLNLPPLLEKRRCQYGIPDIAFEQVALYNWILVHQIPPKWDEDGGGERFSGTSILKPQTRQSRDEKESSRGIIVSAGMAARDVLRSHGVDLGHVISFVRVAPWIRPTGYFGGVEYNLMVLRDGDLITSEDTQDALRSGKVRIAYDEEKHQHYFVDESGKRWNPSDPTIDHSY